jgi:hypothetical protein
MSTDQPNAIEYYNLVSYPPGLDSTTPQQWLHYTCEGNLQIGNDGTIRCEKCDAQQVALSWYIVGNSHLSDVPPEVKQLDVLFVTSLAGQLTTTAGKKWLIEFLGNIEE